MKNEWLKISEIVLTLKKNTITWRSHCTDYNTMTPKVIHSFIMSLT